ncbi:hypothetical protein H4582DRAFT_2016304 [Lactarius indigo]|nr:hypothetical protein H4582DRAFT_2016304 [Lactarius indigo]
MKYHWFLWRCLLSVLSLQCQSVVLFVCCICRPATVMAILSPRKDQFSQQPLTVSIGVSIPPFFRRPDIDIPAIY